MKVYQRIIRFYVPLFDRPENRLLLSVTVDVQKTRIFHDTLKSNEL